MGNDPKRQQKKREKKAAKRKSRHSGGGTQQFAAHPLRRPSPLSATVAAQYPIRDSLVPAELFDVGLGTVVLSRTLPGDRVAAAVLLVDVFALGVKNAFYRVISTAEYVGYLATVRNNETPVPIDPACLRKLVEGAVAYARSIGFAPHEEYADAAPLLGDIDPAACATEYVYGKDGKPLLIF